MIIWINGAFGAGKTQTAFELNRRIQNSFVYDPENVGLFINRNIPKEIRKDDFQDNKSWREMNLSLIRQIAMEFDGVIIIPMTIVNKEYHKEIIENLINEGIALKHFTLMASKETLLKRLKARGDGENSWPAKQIDRCLMGLSSEIFKEHINTNEKTIDEVVMNIGKLCNIEFLSNKDTLVKKKMNRLITQLKHIGFFKWRW